MVVGDFNYSDIRWDELDGACRRKTGRASSIEFLETIDSNFLKQHVLDPTFGKNILDLVLTDDPDRVFSVNIGPPLNSSRANHLHATLFWDYNLADNLETE